MSIEPETGAGQNPRSELPLLELEAFLPYRLNVLAEGVSRSLSRIYGSRFGISVPEWRVVATLGQYGRMTAKQIGEHSRMHKTKVSRAVASLVYKNMLMRNRNQEDRREAFLVLTHQGRAAYERLAPEARAFEAELLGALSVDDRAALDRIVARLRRRSDELAMQLESDA